MNIFTNDDYRRIQAWLKANAIKDSDFVVSEDIVPNEDILVITQNMSTVPTNYRIRIKDLLNSSLAKIVIDSITAKSVKVNNVLTVDAANVKLDNEKGTTLQDVLNYFEDNKLNRHTDDTFDGNLSVKKNITIEGNIKSNDGTTTVEENFEATGEITDGEGNMLSDVNSAAKGWKIEYQDPQQDEPTVRAKYVLKDYKGVPKGNIIKVYKDSAITNVYLGTTEDTCNPDTGEVTKYPIHDNNEALSIVYRLDTGKYMLVNVPIGIFTREAEFDKYRGLGVTENGQVFIKLASDAESSNYLHFNELGEIAADGIEARILRDLGTLIASVAGDGTMWGTYKKYEGTLEYSTSNDGSRWGEYKEAEAHRDALSNSNNIVYHEEWDDSEGPEWEDPIATEASYTYNWKTTDTPAGDGKTEGNLKDLYNTSLEHTAKLSKLEREITSLKVADKVVGLMWGFGNLHPEHTTYSTTDWIEMEVGNIFISQMKNSIINNADYPNLCIYKEKNEDTFYNKILANTENGFSYKAVEHCYIRFSNLTENWINPIVYGKEDNIPLEIKNIKEDISENTNNIFANTNDIFANKEKQGVALYNTVGMFKSITGSTSLNIKYSKTNIGVIGLTYGVGYKSIPLEEVTLDLLQGVVVNIDTGSTNIEYFGNQYGGLELLKKGKILLFVNVSGRLYSSHPEIQSEIDKVSQLWEWYNRFVYLQDKDTNLFDSIVANDVNLIVTLNHTNIGIGGFTNENYGDKSYYPWCNISLNATYELPNVCGIVLDVENKSASVEDFLSHDRAKKFKDSRYILLCINVGGRLYSDIPIISEYIHDIYELNKKDRIVKKITISPDGTFCKIRNTIKSITDASSVNKYEIHLKNGTYNEIDIQMKDYIDVIGESKDGVIIYCNGHDTDNVAPADYGWDGSQTGKIINTIDVAYKHLVLWMSNSKIENVTLKASYCKYVIHQDGANKPYKSELVNCKIIREEDYNHCGDGYYSEDDKNYARGCQHLIGVGAEASQFQYIKDCNFYYLTKNIPNEQNPALVASAFLFHNWNNKLNFCGATLENCNVYGCNLAHLSELGSEQKDIITFINCNVDDNKFGIIYKLTKGFYKDSQWQVVEDTSLIPYCITVEIFGGNIGYILFSDDRLLAYKYVNSYTQCIACANENILQGQPIHAYLGRNKIIATEKDFQFALNNADTGDIIYANKGLVGLGLAYAGTYTYGQSVYISNGKFTNIANGNIVGYVHSEKVLANDGLIEICKLIV